MDSVDQAAKRKRTRSSVVLGEVDSSLPNHMLTLSVDNSEMSKTNTKIAPLRKKWQIFTLQILQSRFDKAKSQQPALWQSVKQFEASCMRLIIPNPPNFSIFKTETKLIYCLNNKIFIFIYKCFSYFIKNFIIFLFFATIC